MFVFKYSTISDTFFAAIIRKILRPFQFGETTTTSMPMPTEKQTIMTAAPINQPTAQVTDDEPPEKPPTEPDEPKPTEKLPTNVEPTTEIDDGDGMPDIPSKLTIGDDRATTVGINDKIDLDPIEEEINKKGILVLLPFSYNKNSDSI